MLSDFKVRIFSWLTALFPFQSPFSAQPSLLSDVPILRTNGHHELLSN